MTPMINDTPHISVCICTFKRLPFLRRLLAALAAQETGGLFTYSVVVADNDPRESAKPVVGDWAPAGSAMRVSYCLEARQNIALTLNKAIENAKGEFIAFIDDDEWPTPRWLLT